MFPSGLSGGIHILRPFIRRWDPSPHTHANRGHLSLPHTITPTLNPNPPPHTGICMMGNKVPHVKIDDSPQCNYKCAADTTKICGGYGGMAGTRMQSVSLCVMPIPYPLSTIANQYPLVQHLLPIPSLSPIPYPPSPEGLPHWDPLPHDH